MLCAVHAELKLSLTNKAIMAFAAFEETNVLLLEYSVTDKVDKATSLNLDLGRPVLLNTHY